jgi:ABC-2 type transport system ATP-binding protein
MQPNAISVRGLQVKCGNTLVLPSLDLDVQAGTVTGLVGPSGCGKTTLMRALVGVQIVAAGAVTVLGMPAGSAALRSRVAYVTQSGSVYTDLTVRENVAYLARVLGADSGEVSRVIEAVGLGGLSERVVGRLSGGQRHRVSLAGALLGEAELLVLDEPTVGLDPLLRRDLWAMFSRLRDEGATLIVSTHVVDEAARCEQVLLMHEGRLLAHGTPQQLRERGGSENLDDAFVHLVEEDLARTASAA